MGKDNLSIPKIAPKVAIFHYWFVSWRGGEKVIENLLKIFPQADIYTLFCSQKIRKSKLNKNRVKTSWLNFFSPIYQEIFPLYSLAISTLKMDKKYDLIFSSESGPIKGFKRGVLNKNTPHICYVHTPMRYCWGFTDHYLNKNFIINKLLLFFFNRLKKWDLTTIDNVDVYLSNSKNVKQRIKKYYNRDSTVVYPPIDTTFFKKLFKTSIRSEKKKFYLSFGAITPYKKIDLLVDTFAQLKNKQLIIVGDGKEKKKLQKIIEKKKLKNIQLLDKMSYSQLIPYFSQAKAFLFPGEEDFGMTPLEMMSMGIPIIAYRKGGAVETVLENKNCKKSTGIFFRKQTIKSLKLAILKFEKIKSQLNPKFIMKHAQQFDQFFFNEKIKKIVEKYNIKKL